MLRRRAGGDVNPTSPSDIRRYLRERLLCEDGRCIGVLRPAPRDALYRGVPQVLCPVCGWRGPLPARVPSWWDV